MSAVSEALLRRISKIKALADRGIDGEQATAQSMLENILARHNLTMADIEDEKPVRNWVEVHYSGKHELKLMFQIIRKVAQISGSVSYRQRKRVRTSLSVQLSAAEHVEVEFLFALMSEALTEEFDKLVSAFIVRNRLFGPRAERDENESEPEQTPEERARLRQIAAMADMMNPVTVRKAITA